MRILHTADWHLSDRLKQIDRTADLQRGVERIAAYCDQESVDVLLIAGDLFSDLARPEALAASLGHLSRTFRPFLLGGGTIVAIPGNHDSDIYCDMLRRAFQLAAPNSARPGDVLPGGRLYLINKPSHFRLRGPRGREVSFACMPYPTTGRYLRGRAVTGYTGFDERSKLLRGAFLQQLRGLYQQLDMRQPRVLIAHINAIASKPEKLFRCGLEEDIVVDDPAVKTGWSYVALGHLHGPGIVDGLKHVRYSGSIERLNIGEKKQRKGVVFVSIGDRNSGVRARFLPLPATTFYDVCINEPRTELPLLRTRYPEARTALTRCHIRCRHGEDNLYEILGEISRVFPRCYERTWSERRGVAAKKDGPDASASVFAQPRERRSGCRESTGDQEQRAVPDPGWSLHRLVMDYFSHQLADDVDRDSLMSLARQLLEESE